MRALLLRRSQSLLRLSAGLCRLSPLSPPSSLHSPSSRPRSSYGAPTVVVDRPSESFSPSTPLLQDDAEHVDAITRHDSDPPLSSTLRLPQGDAQDIPAAWLSAVEPYLPLRLKSARPRWPLLGDPGSVLLKDLPELVLRARKQADADIPLLLALEHNRWDAMLWIFDAILQLSKSEVPNPDEKSLLRSIPYPPTTYLDDWTTRPQTLGGIKLPDLRTASSATSLDAFTKEPYSTAHVASWRRSQSHVGLLWLSAARLLLAQDRRDPTSEKKVRYALRMLGLLHYHGYIPPKVYNDPSDNGTLGIRQPTMISSHMDSIMSALFDATVHSEDQSQDSNPFIRPELTTEVWIEFILWCCVRGGWLMEAASILKMLQSQSRPEWHLGVKQVKIPPRGSDTSRVDRRRRGPDFPKNTTSADVVIALIDAMAKALHTGPLRTEKLENILEHLFHLQQFLRRENIEPSSMGSLEFLARMADAPQNILTEHPRDMERLLTAFQPLSTSLVKGVRASQTLAHFPKSGSLAALDFHHHILQLNLESDDQRAVLHALKALMDYTDANKQQALATFPTSKSDRVGSFIRKTGRNTIFDPSLPPGIVAGMLDLFVQNRMFDICSWLIYSTDPDGPIITPSMQDDKRIQYSLFRYAIADNDKDLLLQIAQQRSKSDYAGLYIASMESRLSNRNWTLAQNMMEQPQYAAHEWRPIHISTLLRSLLPSVADTDNEEDSKAASEILHTLLRGDCGPLWGKDKATISTIVLLLSSANPLLRAICADLVNPSNIPQLQLPRRSFDAILEGLLVAFGSSTGMEVWRSWCGRSTSCFSIPWSFPRTLDTSESNFSESVMQFSAQSIQPQTADAQDKLVLQSGAVDPGLSTIRLIITQALWEKFNAQSESEKAAPSNVLAWARGVLQTRFHLDSPAARSLTGSPRRSKFRAKQMRSPHSAQSDLPYSFVTINLWTNMLHSKNPLWGEGTEERMRRLATAEEPQQLDLGPMNHERRLFVHELAMDLGLVAESVGAEPSRSVRILKEGHGPYDIPPESLADIFKTKV